MIIDLYLQGDIIAIVISSKFMSEVPRSSGSPYESLTDPYHYLNIVGHNGGELGSVTEEVIGALTGLVGTVFNSASADVASTPTTGATQRNHPR
jgi:hypothetical protein